MQEITIELGEHSNLQLERFMAKNNIVDRSIGLKALVSEYFLIRPPEVSEYDDIDIDFNESAYEAEDK